MSIIDSVFIVFIGLAMGWAVGSLFFWSIRGPKFKEGDWVKARDEVGEFTTRPGTSWFYIRKVGKNSYLTDFYGVYGGELRLIAANYETTLYSRKYYEKVSTRTLPNLPKPEDVDLTNVRSIK